MERKNKYISLTFNGRLFPTWIMANFKKYKLSKIISSGQDPCNSNQIHLKKELLNYQKFLGEYLNYNSIYNSILLYHGLGSGKTISAVNIYNVLYHRDSIGNSPEKSQGNSHENNKINGINVFLLIKAALHDDPWISTLKEWLYGNNVPDQLKNIRFIHYDSPTADKQFLETLKQSNMDYLSLFIIDEVHNFIRNVYNNKVTGQLNKKAYVIYNNIIRIKKEDSNTRIICLSGTPAINEPFELALLFNLLRPNIFPDNEDIFNKYFLSDGLNKQLNISMKNLFQRRIIGLVSYYSSYESGIYALEKRHIVDCEMSKYHEEIYDHYDKIEKSIRKNMKKKVHLFIKHIHDRHVILFFHLFRKILVVI